MDKDWEKIEAIEGLEVAAGLKVIGGDRELYKRLLQLLYKQLIEFDQKFPEALKSGDRKSQRFLAHSLKGACANLGAMALYRALQMLDESCKQEADFAEIEARFTEAQQCALPLIAQLSELFD